MQTGGWSGPYRPLLGAGVGDCLVVVQDPDVDPLLDPDEGGPPEPDGRVPEPDPLPMLGQFLVEPDPGLALEPDDELAEPVPVVPDPELPEVVLNDGAVVEELELVPEFPVAVDVVAASATSAPPARSPDVSAPTARTLRKRIFMGGVPFRVMCHAEPVRFGADTMHSRSWGARRAGWARPSSSLTKR
jgi:hypothetical protein